LFFFPCSLDHLPWSAPGFSTILFFLSPLTPPHTSKISNKSPEFIREISLIPSISIRNFNLLPWSDRGLTQQGLRFNLLGCFLLEYSLVKYNKIISQTLP
jgi:hypothetical protein